MYVAGGALGGWSTCWDDFRTMLSTMGFRVDKCDTSKHHVHHALPHQGCAIRQQLQSPSSQGLPIQETLMMTGPWSGAQ